MGPLDTAPYPDVVDPDLVGTYPALVPAGSGFVWDDVLEYRVWCHPERGAPDLDEGNDYYLPFATYAEAVAFSQATEGAEEPLALIRQLEYIDEPRPGEYRHVKERASLNGPPRLFGVRGERRVLFRIFCRRTHPRTDWTSSAVWRIRKTDRRAKNQTTDWGQRAPKLLTLKV